jgi:enamine deaminase RidA (YjgF/YER057c/UK114 family)
MLVVRDIQAFVAQDWSRVADDFVKEGFMGIDAGGKTNPDFWALKYPTLADYREEWLRQARIFGETKWKEDPEVAFYEATRMRDIEIQGDVALIHKKFDGYLHNLAGEKTILNWQTLYRCRKINGRWKIAGFTGYMPYGKASPAPRSAKIKQPDTSSQHVTAGPYSPVLEVQADTLVVISGQAAIDANGNVVGETIEEQTRGTMENCKKQLESAGASLNDVFKVNVYMTDLDLWPRFNVVYKTYFNDPMPVRAAVGTNLLMTLLVEIEMWAVKNTEL